MMQMTLHGSLVPGTVARDRGAQPAAGRQLRSSFRAMGCEMALTVEAADSENGGNLLGLARAEIEQIEQILSRFRADSEVCRLNAGAGAWQTVSPALATVLGVALAAARATDGLCSPTLLSALEAAGYDRDFSAIQRTASQLTSLEHEWSSASHARGPRRVAARGLRQLPLARAGRSWRAIRTADLGRRVWLPRGVRVDLAGVAKGWTADRVADLLALAGPCLVDAGGDLAARGAPAGLDGWPVAVASPIESESDLALVSLRDAGIATSGIDFRRWMQAGKARHHLIDPRTGRPARTDAISVTVIAPTTVEADIEAKTALLLGVRAGLARLRHRGLAGLIVRRDGHQLRTPTWSDYAIS